MVEHEADVWAGTYQGDGVLQVLVEDAEIEREAVLRQDLDTANEVRTDAEIEVWLALVEAADTLDARIDGDHRVQERAGTVAVFKRRPRHDPQDRRTVFWLVGDPLRFEQGVGRGHLDLEVDDPFDVETSRVLAKLGQTERLADPL